MAKVKILGICGSPRRGGNTEILVKEALKAAEEIPGVESEFLALAEMKIEGGCRATYPCWRKPSLERPCMCYREDRDDINKILKAMMRADGIIIGAPSYWGGVPAQLKTVLDKSMAIEMGFHLRNKVGGAIAIAAERNGGQEATIDSIHRWFYIHDMIVCGVGPARPATSIGGHWGAMATQGFPYPVHSDQPGEKQAVLQDEIGLNAVRCLGKRVAELTKIVRAGLAQLPDQELAWPRGFVHSEVFDRAEREAAESLSGEE
ncbi:MAG: flavodoxin family protein [Chloroflexi bacterium]|nr:flavodoxin family protein [Chloroflexota bacterium]MCL5074297.1 flavodoxin family protein [Chloroflexota bacterium]